MGDVQLSKNMAYILRHGSQSLQSDGFMFVEDLLKQDKCRSYTESNVEQVVRNCPKKRFELQRDGATGKLKVRATQGHTVKLDDEAAGLVPIDPRNIPTTVVHGTNAAAWNNIRKTGLDRMRRAHIHFAVGEIGDSSVISGMPPRSDIYIYVDIASAMRDGIPFYRSTNNVILSPGNQQGVLPIKHFKIVKNRSGAQLFP